MKQDFFNWICTIGLCVLMIAIIVGVFFLKSYRWGNCP